MASGFTVNIPSSYLKKIRAIYPNISLDHLGFNQDGMVNDVVIVNHELGTHWFSQRGSTFRYTLKLTQHSQLGTRLS